MGALEREALRCHHALESPGERKHADTWAPSRVPDFIGLGAA